MATTLNADTVTGGFIATGDASGDLALQAAGTTLVTLTGTKALFEAGMAEEYEAVTSSAGAASINLNNATNFSITLTENTTFTFSNPVASGRTSSFTLKVVQDSTDRTITWPASVDWPSATAPTISSGSGAVDYFVFITHDAGTTYYGFTAGQALG